MSKVRVNNEGKAKLFLTFAMLAFSIVVAIETKRVAPITSSIENTFLFIISFTTIIDLLKIL